MANRFQASAQRIIDGNLGSLQKPFQIYQVTGFDYATQTPTRVLIADTTAFKRSLSKKEFETQSVQIGDFALIFTDLNEVDVDTFEGVYNGREVYFVTSTFLGADAAQMIIARVK